MEYAAGTSLVVITLTSSGALAVRAGDRLHTRLGPGARAHRGLRNRWVPRRQASRPDRPPLDHLHRPRAWRRGLHRSQGPARTALTGPLPAPMSPISHDRDIHLTGVTWCSDFAAAACRRALPQVAGEFRSWFAIRYRRGLLGLSGLAALAGRLRVPALRERRRLDGRRWWVPVRVVPCADSGHGGHDVRSSSDAADGVVRGLLDDVRVAEGRLVHVEFAACAGGRFVSDRVGDAASAAIGAGASGRARLTGTVEVDETYIGGEEPATGCAAGAPRARKPLWAPRLSSTNHGGVAGRGWCRCRRVGQVPTCRRHRPRRARRPGHHRRVDRLPRHRQARLHPPPSQRAARARGEDPGELLPAVHRVASLAKRWLLGTHQGSVDEAHLQSYLNEFVFHFNRRRSRSGGMVSSRVLELAVAHTLVRYRDLVADPKPKRTRPLPSGSRGHASSLDRPRAAQPWRGVLTCATPVK